MLRYASAITAAGLILLASGRGARASTTLVWFEQYLDALRQQVGIPGLSAALVSDQGIFWERGFGFQDIENGVRASPDTLYPVGDVTRVFTSVLLLRCVESGTLHLDDRVEVPGPGGADVATVGSILSQTPARPGPPVFTWDPARFGILSAVVDACAHQPFRLALARQILDRLAMQDSVPGHDLEQPPEDVAKLFDERERERYVQALRRLARPYAVDRKGRAKLSAYPPKSLDASTGLVSTVRDLARFDAGLREAILLRPETLAAAWTPPVANDGTASPYGLGWFVQIYAGQPVAWHFGVSPGAFSSLVLKVPGRGLTLILLANSDGLSAQFALEKGDVNTSPFAKLFLRLFA